MVTYETRTVVYHGDSWMWMVESKWMTKDVYELHGTDDGTGRPVRMAKMIREVR